MNRILDLCDNELVLNSGDSAVGISTRYQGRIFAGNDKGLFHQFRYDLAADLHPTEFNNLGGNSLWPAPEGGDYAFNYLPEAPEKWLVQEAINSVCPEKVSSEPDKIKCSKLVELRNRAGANLSVRMSREVKLLDITSEVSGYDLTPLAYWSRDTIEYQTPQELSLAPIAAWSLEQFPGCENIVAFGRVGSGNAKAAVNDDFYGDPWPRLQFGDGTFIFNLGGTERLQIGISAASDPEFIGAFDPKRNLVIIRKTLNVPGKRINIADNEQKNGVFSAQDMYSIFNGATLNFFELETIAPMDMTSDGKVSGSKLISETRFFTGEADELKKYLRDIYLIEL